MDLKLSFALINVVPLSSIYRSPRYRRLHFNFCVVSDEIYKVVYFN